MGCQRWSITDSTLTFDLAVVFFAAHLSVFIGGSTSLRGSTGCPLVL